MCSLQAQLLLQISKTGVPHHRLVWSTLQAHVCMEHAAVCMEHAALCMEHAAGTWRIVCGSVRELISTIYRIDKTIEFPTWWFIKNAEWSQDAMC
jgi:hypothetical protein